MKQILFAASEAAPFIKTGGLAEVVGALPWSFDPSVYDVRLILPKYACMEETYALMLRPLCHFTVDLNWRRQYAGILTCTYKGITCYFVDNEFYFAGDRPYGQIYEDVEKFAFFSKAVVQCLPYIDFAPQIIHCHDWQTGLIPVFLHTSFGSDPYYCGIKTVFTIHNLKFQGRWKLHEVMDITGLPPQIFNDRQLESYGDANCLKGGVVYADAITTVSENYAKEIQTKEGGEGLDGLFFARRDSLFGIRNGIDEDVYDPKTDPYLPCCYGSKNLIGAKRTNKAALQKELSLPQKSGSFVIGMISRVTEQKGFDLLAGALEEMLGTIDLQLLTLGDGEERLLHMLSYYEARYPDRMCVRPVYEDGLAHRIYAAADAILMPSLFEPCGISQMIAMRYGTVPIVRETGGLSDTVEAYNEYEDTGDGFSFAHYSAQEMLGCVRYARQVFSSDVPAWRRIMRRAMSRDFSWASSVKSYEDLYERLCG